MSSLYGRLFRYRASDTQTPRENYLTEALCDLLNRIGGDAPEAQRVLLKNLKLFESDGVEPLCFQTQVSISTETRNKFPDLVGYIGGVPVLVIEVKVDAEINYDAVLRKNQLQIYGEWLAEVSQGRKDAVLALLTYRRPPPQDFFEKEADYGIAASSRRVIHWRDVRREMEALQGSHHTVYPTLAKEFCNFLHEQGVAVETPEKDDFNKLGAYLKGGTAARLRNFMNSIRTRLKEMTEQPDLSWESDLQLQSGGAFRDEAQVLTGWVNTKKPEISYISWGLYYVPDGDADPYRFHEFFGIPRVHGVFLNTVYKTEVQQACDGDPKDDWYPLRSGKSGLARAVAFKPLDGFVEDTDALMEWFETKFKEACTEMR
ncbi:MAG: hypothetical protein FWH34_04325 [Desulfovibrionaceae bacterium]|nr:hypothetical protein [Desulfovibrionaceae bacterium]